MVFTSCYCSRKRFVLINRKSARLVSPKCFVGHHQNFEDQEQVYMFLASFIFSSNDSVPRFNFFKGLPAMERVELLSTCIIEKLSF